MNQKLLRNITLDYIYCFLKNIDLSSAIWVLYLLYRGLPLWQVGLLEGIFHGASFLSEIPTGTLADLFGRKKTMIAGRICSVLASIFMIFSRSFWGYALAFVFNAWSYNLNSGSEEALIYDSLKLCKKEESYIRINGRLNIIIEAAQGLSTFLGGMLSEYSYLYCYLSAILIALLSIVPALFFKEPISMPHNTAKGNKNFLDHFKNSFSILRQSREIQKILVFYPITFTFYMVVFFYGQKYFSDYGLNRIQISIIMLLAGIASCFGAFYSGVFLEILKERTKYIASLFMGLSILGMSFHSLGTAVLMFLIASFANALLYPIQSDSLNRLIPSEQRATIISVNSMLFSLMMIVIFPLAGFAAELMGFGKTFFFLGTAQLLFILLLLGRKKRM